MPLNFGYAGLGRELTYGSGAAPVAFARLQEVPSLEVEQRFAEVPGTDDFGLVGVIPTTRSGKGDLSMVATPGVLGHVLTALLGAPTTAEETHDFIHIFTPTAGVPSYTVETLDGTGVKRLVGAKVTELTLSHTADGLLTAKTTWVGADKLVGDTRATPTLETIYFAQRGVVISFFTAPHEVRIEDLEVRLSFPKEIHHGFGSPIGVACEPTGEGDVTAQATLRFFSDSDAEKFTDYVNGTVREMSVFWMAPPRATFILDFVAYITADPSVPQNRDLRAPRIRLSLRAVREGAPLVTAKLRNYVSSY